MASHLGMEERKRISELRQAGCSRGRMAQALARAKSTIWREIQRNRLGCLYDAEVAQRKAQERRRQRKMDRPEIADQVRRGLQEYHSPDEIAGRMKRATPEARQRVSATTIYRWIRRQPPGTWDRNLRRYGQQPRGRKHGSIPGAVEIRGRPTEATERAACGHWEGDTVWGSQKRGGLPVVVKPTWREAKPATFTTRGACGARFAIPWLVFGRELDRSQCTGCSDHGSNPDAARGADPHLAGAAGIASTVCATGPAIWRNCG